MTSARKTLGIVGARGHTGAELIRLVAAHPALELVFVSSRELDGQRVAEHVDGYAGELRYASLDADAVAAQGADVVVLALPNGKAAPYVEAIDKAKPDTLILDLSADYRFDSSWYYGLPELTRDKWRGEKRISNPGCYATAIQLSIAPLKDLLAAPPVCFGVSGYSGAGTTPSDKNNPEKLRDNLMRLGVTKMSAGVSTQVGGHATDQEETAQFDISDDRSVDEMARVIYGQGYQPVYKDWQYL